MSAYPAPSVLKYWGDYLTNVWLHPVQYGVDFWNVATWFYDNSLGDLWKNFRTGLLTQGQIDSITTNAANSMRAHGATDEQIQSMKALVNDYVRTDSGGTAEDAIKKQNSKFWLAIGWGAAFLLVGVMLAEG